MPLKPFTDSQWNWLQEQIDLRIHEALDFHLEAQPHHSLESLRQGVMKLVQESQETSIGDSPAVKPEENTTTPTLGTATTASSNLVYRLGKALEGLDFHLSTLMRLRESMQSDLESVKERLDTPGQVAPEPLD